MKKIIAIVLCVFSTTAYSQESFHITGNVGYSVRTYNLSDFNTFVESFNSYYSEILTQKLSPYSSTNSGFSFGLGGIVKINKTAMAFMYDRTESNQFQRATFGNGYNYNFDLGFKSHHFNFDVSFAPSSAFEIGFLAGSSLSSSKMNVTGWMYSEDNFTHDYRFAALNGIYRSALKGSVNAGIVSRINIGKFASIQARAFRMFDLFSSTEFNYLDAYEDNSPGKIFFGTHFPKNMEKFYDDIENMNYDFEDNIVVPSLLGWCFEVGLLIKIGKTND
jgi:hypothetical protein